MLEQILVEQWKPHIYQSPWILILDCPTLALVHCCLLGRRSTKKEDVGAFGRGWLLDVTIDMNDEGDGNTFNAGNFCGSLMAAVQARWRSLILISPDHNPTLYLVQPACLHAST